jgi:hypothetical protein
MWDDDESMQAIKKEKRGRERDSEYPHALKSQDHMPVHPEISFMLLPVQPGKCRASAMKDVTVASFYDLLTLP